MSNGLEVINRYLTLVVDRKGSDLHIQTGAPPAIRALGEVQFLQEPPLTNERAEGMLMALLDEVKVEELFSSGNVDFAYELPGIARFRCNLLLQHYGYGGVFRVIPSKIPTMTELGLPPILEEICFFNKGLVVVTGPTGSGKSTTLAAMINHINHSRSVHIITVEDPIEYAHPSATA
ncbi:type IV pili twitching motility protein PilT, partial [bacterium CPR1]|nr:type IV pili twitching motility protein PilT [bacterium CPR1]